MSIASIQYKYPSAIWFDSNHVGTNLGTLDNPYTSLSTAFNAITSNANVIAILNGTHTGTINTPLTLGGGAADTLTLVGESTSAVLSGVLNKAAGYDLKLETLKFYNDGSGAYAISLDSNTSTFEGCILDNNRASASINTAQRGFFRGSGTSIITFRRNIFSVWAGNAQYYGSILGGSQGQGFAQVTFESNTIVTQGTDQLISHYNNPSSIVFKNNIISGSGIEYIRHNNASTVSETISNNCYFNTATTTANAKDTGGAIFADPQFIDADSGNFSLRPSSPLIGGFSETSSRYRLYVTAAEKAGPISSSTPADNASFYRFSNYTGSKFLVGMRTSYNGEIYECILEHDYDSTQDPSSDSTNWRLVEGTINDPYKSCDFNDSEGTINNKLTNNHDLILLDGDYSYFPITSDSSYPTTSPILRPLNKHKAIIFHYGFRPAGFITKDLIFQNNSLAKYGYADYPLDGRVGFHIEGCVVHSAGTWWPPLNCVVKGSLIFIDLNNSQGMFYGGFSQATSPAPTDKAITFIENTVIFTGSLNDTNDSVLTSLINQGNMDATFKRNIFYLKSEFNAGPATKWTLSVFDSLAFEDNVAFDESGVIVDDLRGMQYIDPKFIDINSSDYSSYRLRPDSPLIGGVNKSKYPMDSVWVQPGSGTAGTGTENNAFYWSQYSDAFLAATQTTSKQVIFKDGEYLWTSTILQDDNVGNSITMVAENMHQAIFYDDGRISSSGEGPTLRFTGIQLKARDHFTHLPECHYVFDSVHLVCNKQIGALSVTATGSIFEVATGANVSIFNNSGPVNIRNCIFADHNDRPPSYDYLTDANSGTIKNTIFYTKYPRADCIRTGQSAVLISCASENITNQKSGIEYFNNLGFIDIENKNYNLRPKSPLIGQGE